MQEATQFTPVVEVPLTNVIAPKAPTAGKPQKKRRVSCLVSGCISCLGMTICLGALIFGVSTILVNNIGHTLAEASGSLDKLCDISAANLQEFYQNNTTADYQSRVSFNDFRRVYLGNTEVFASCSGRFSNVGIREFITTQIAVNDDGQKLWLNYVARGKLVQLELVKNNWLINNLSVN